MFEELGAWGAHEHAMMFARAHGLELAPRSRAPVYPAGLTEDAMLVLTAFAAGKSLSVVAGELVMDERTVERLLDDARERAQVKTPGAAVEWLDRHGLALPLSRTTGRGSGGLSAREIEVIGLIAVGRTNQQIADELVISLHTVARHVANIFDKTGAANRTEAVHFATTHGVALPLSRTTGSTDTGVRRSVDLAFLFEDIRGSSVLNEALGDDRYYELLALHNEELEGAIARHGGAVVKHTGDGYFATFPDTAAALAGALDIESRFPLALWGEPESVMRIAVGVHAGGGVAARGDVYGIAVAKTCRICALAAGGEVLVSELARHRAPEGRFRFVDRGGVSLKGFSGPMRIYQVFPR
jgi:class 3 adenylate cyclase